MRARYPAKVLRPLTSSIPTEWPREFLVLATRSGQKSLLTWFLFVWIPMVEDPRSISGRILRAHITRWLEELDTSIRDQILRFCAQGDSPEEPENKVETRLRNVQSRRLGRINPSWVSVETQSRQCKLYLGTRPTNSWLYCKIWCAA